MSRTFRVALLLYAVLLPVVLGYLKPSVPLAISLLMPLIVVALRWPLAFTRWFNTSKVEELVFPESGAVIVQLVNDSKTPMEFVVRVLEDVFGKSRQQAIQIMLQTHREGRGTCGTYVVHEAREKIAEVLKRAKKKGYPLACNVLPDATFHTQPLPHEVGAAP